MVRFSLYLTPLFFALAYPFTAHAGAWLQPEGKGQLITTALYYRTDTFYDRNGARVAQDPFSKSELNPYLEYGLYDWLTVGGNMLLDSASASNNPFNMREDYYSLQSEFFARTTLWKDDQNVISLQPLVKLPTLYFDDSLDHRRTQFDAELSLLYGYSFSVFGINQFTDFGLAYRYRDAVPNDQIRASASWGIYIDDEAEWLLLGQAFATIATKISPTAPLTQQPEDDYDLIKLQLSAVYRIDDEWSVQAGSFVHGLARNTGGDGGVFTSLWRNF